MNSRQPQPSKAKSDFWGAVKLLLLIILIAMITVLSQQMDMDPASLKIVGRVAVTIGLIVLLYGLIKQLGKVIVVLGLVLLAAMVLVTEGVIDLPRL